MSFKVFAVTLLAVTCMVQASSVSGIVVASQSPSPNAPVVAAPAAAVAAHPAAVAAVAAVFAPAPAAALSKALVVASAEVRHFFAFTVALLTLKGVDILIVCSYFLHFF